MHIRINFAFKLIITSFILAIFSIYINRDVYGENFINEIRLSDRNNILIDLTNPELIKLGNEVCLRSNTWDNLSQSNKDVAIEISRAITVPKNNLIINESSSIITFLRYQSIYELCPENIYILSKLVEQKKNNE